MNIAILSHEYPPDTGLGGIGTDSYYQARALLKRHRLSEKMKTNSAPDTGAARPCRSA